MAGVGEDRSEAGRDRPTNRPTTGRRFTVPEAADVLGITVEAVRGRIKRGTLAHERTGERVYVFLDERSYDQSAAGRDRGDDRTHDQTSDRPGDRTELVEELRDRVAHLERELERRGVEAMRYQEIVAGLTRTNAELSARLPELEPAAPSEARGSDLRAGATGTPTDTPAGRETGTRRPWWRRLIGG